MWVFIYQTELHYKHKHVLYRKSFKKVIISEWHSGYSGFHGMEVEIHAATVATPPRNIKSAPEPSLLAPRDQSAVIGLYISLVRLQFIFAVFPLCV